MRHSSVEAVRCVVCCLCPSLRGIVSCRNRKMPRYFSTPAGCSVDKDWSSALIPRVKPSIKSQPHARTPHTLEARDLWDTRSL